MDGLEATTALREAGIHRWTGQIADRDTDSWASLVLSYADPSWSVLRMDLIVIHNPPGANKPRLASQATQGTRRTAIEMASRELSFCKRLFRRIHYRGQNLGEIAATPEFRSATETETDTQLNAKFQQIKSTLELVDD